MAIQQAERKEKDCKTQVSVLGLSHKVELEQVYIMKNIEVSDKNCVNENYVSWAIEIITKEDLQIFREVLIAELKDLLYPVVAKPIKSWLKATEVRKLLGISANTLQNLRVTGKLHPKKVGGINYYRYSDIVQLLDGTE